MGEGEIVTKCLLWLNQNGFFAWRNNSTGVYDRTAGGYRKPPPFCINGVSDIIALREGKTYFIEVKTSSGVQRVDQILFEKQCKKHGINYWLIRSVEGLENATRQCDLEATTK